MLKRYLKRGSRTLLAFAITGTLTTLGATTEALAGERNPSTGREVAAQGTDAAIINKPFTTRICDSRNWLADAGYFIELRASVYDAPATTIAQVYGPRAARTGVCSDPSRPYLYEITYVPRELGTWNLKLCYGLGMRGVIVCYDAGTLEVREEPTPKWAWSDGSIATARTFKEKKYRTAKRVPRVLVTAPSDEPVTARLSYFGKRSKKWITESRRPLPAGGRGSLSVNPLCDGDWCTGAYDYKVTIGSQTVKLRIRFVPR